MLISQERLKEVIARFAGMDYSDYEHKHDLTYLCMAGDKLLEIMKTGKLPKGPVDAI